jgi:hypothetical protein
MSLIRMGSSMHQCALGSRVTPARAVDALHMVSPGCSGALCCASLDMNRGLHRISLPWRVASLPKTPRVRCIAGLRPRSMQRLGYEVVKGLINS